MIGNLSVIRPASKEHISAVAQIHCQCIPSGFLSSLGPKFLSDLYGNLNDSRFGILLVAVYHDEVVGFIAGCTHTKKLWSEFLFKRGLAVLINLKIKATAIRRFFEILSYPFFKKRAKLPNAEILSIAVTPDFRRFNAAIELIRALNEEFSKRGVKEFKILVGNQFNQVKQFYEALGYVPVYDVQMHGRASSIYVGKVI